MSFGERFLSQPDFFPARLSGEPWGGEWVAIHLPGGPFFFHGLSAHQVAALAGHLGPAVEVAPVSGAGRKTYRPGCRVFRATAADFRPLDARGWHYEPDCDPSPRGIRLAGIGLMGLLSDRLGEEGGLWTPHAKGEAFLGAWENFFRLQLAYRLLARGGLLLHSAGIVSSRSKRACILFGPSGIGKSTCARRASAQGWTVLSDDLNALLPEEGGWRAHPLPLAGEMGPQPAQAEGVLKPPVVGALCRLVQGPESDLSPLGSGAAVAALMASAPAVNQDPQVLGVLTDVVAGLMARHPVRRLTVPLDRPFLHLLEDGVPASPDPPAA